MKLLKNEILVIGACVLLLVLCVVFVTVNNNAVGQVEGQPYSVKRTEVKPFQAGTWVYYDANGVEKPLDCSNTFQGVNCKDGDTVNVTIHFNTRGNVSGQNIKVDGVPRDIRCAERGLVVVDCLTTNP